MPQGAPASPRLRSIQRPVGPAGRSHPRASSARRPRRASMRPAATRCDSDASSVCIPSLAPVAIWFRNWLDRPSRTMLRTACVAMSTSNAPIRPPPILGTRPLRDDRLQRIGELHADLRLLVAGEHVDDPIDRLRRVVRVQRREHQVTGLGDGERRAIVSGSRISPTSTTSGSSRSTARTARANESASTPTSRWLTAERLCRCRYSIGSSIVTM